jgi:hypothetical protein
MEYRTLYVTRHVMPDDRLADVHLAADGSLVFSLRAWHIHPALVQAMGDISRSFSNSGIIELCTNADRPPGILAWLESGNLAAPLVPRIPAAIDGRLAIEIQVSQDMIDPALMREMNEHVLPYVCSLLVPVTATARS